MNLKKATAATDKKLPAGGQRLCLDDFMTRETSITSDSQLNKIVGGDASDANPRPPLIIIVRHN